MYMNRCYRIQVNYLLLSVLSSMQDKAFNYNNSASTRQIREINLVPHQPDGKTQSSRAFSYDTVHCKTLLLVLKKSRF